MQKITLFILIGLLCSCSQVLVGNSITQKSSEKKNRIMMMAGSEADPNADFGLWLIDPYLVIDQNASPGANPNPLTMIDIQMAQGEYRDAVFMVGPHVGNRIFKFEVESSDGFDPNAILIQQAYYIHMRQSNRTIIDPIYKLENGTLLIPKGESRQIWVRFDTRYNNVAPGHHNFAITITELNTHQRQVIPGNIEVWGFCLPSYDILANNSWAMFNSCEFDSEELTAKAVADMKMYGLNQVFIHPTEMPRTIVDANGDLLHFDNKVFEKRVRAIQKGWQSVPSNERLQYHLGTLVINTFQLKRPDVEYTGKKPTTKWKIIFPKWYTNLKSVTRRLGIADKDLIMVLHDEPRETDIINGVIPLAKAIKDLDPNIAITSNTSSVVSDPVKAKEFFKLIDIFQPSLDSIEGFYRDRDPTISNPQLLSWLRSSGKPIWTYRCLGGFGPGTYHYQYYRTYSWRMLKYNLSGIGIWTYCAQGFSPWNNNNNLGYVLAYKHWASDNIVHSRRYEMYRQTADDYRYVCKLREVAALNGSQAQVDAEALISAAIADITADYSDTGRCDKWRKRIAQSILDCQKKK